MGDNPPSIEAEIAKLIKTIYGADIKPEKKAIHKWLKTQGLTLKDIVGKATRKQIEETIPHLAQALKTLAGTQP